MFKYRLKSVPIKLGITGNVLWQWTSLKQNWITTWCKYYAGVIYLYVYLNYYQNLYRDNMQHHISAFSLQEQWKLEDFVRRQLPSLKKSLIFQWFDNYFAIGIKVNQFRGKNTRLCQNVRVHALSILKWELGALWKEDEYSSALWNWLFIWSCGWVRQSFHKTEQIYNVCSVLKQCINNKSYIVCQY